MAKMTEQQIRNLYRLLGNAQTRMKEFDDHEVQVYKGEDRLRVTVETVPTAWAFASTLTRLHMSEERENTSEDHQAMSRIILRPHVYVKVHDVQIVWYLRSEV